MKRGSDVLAYTCSYGSRNYLARSMPTLRGTAGCWYDWLICLGAPGPELRATAESALHSPGGEGIQHLKIWPQNRGQHHATALALKMARDRGYRWLLRLDDDLTPRTKKWLKKMIDRLEKLKTLKEDDFDRFVASPRIVGLNNPLSPRGTINAGQSFPAEVMEMVGGACRLHPVALLEDYEPPLYDPVGRGDPQSMASYIENRTGGFILRFPDIRMVHNTTALEAKDTDADQLIRKMGRHWCYLGPGA